MAFVNTRQICKYQTGKSLIEFNDRLQIAKVENAANLHSTYSKIYVVAMDYSKGKGDNTVIADLNLDPDTVKYIYDEVRSGKPLTFTEQKILAHKKNEAGESKVTIFSIKFNEKMNYPWNVIVENGVGIPEKQENGGTALQRGSYKKEKQVRLFISDMDMKKLFRTINDYIVAFEASIIGPLLKERAEFEEKQKNK